MVMQSSQPSASLPMDKKAPALRPLGVNWRQVLTETLFSALWMSLLLLIPYSWMVLT